MVFSGATALTGGATVNVNAGTLKVGSTLSGAGAAVLVNSGATLAGGPAGAIEVPVTINSGGVLVPDASQASTALIGSSLTMAAGAVFQWVYSSPTAEGTLALGSNTLNLPASGNPIFRPANLPTLPALGTYVMTWTSPPANTPAWTIDTSLQTAGNFATWGFNGSGNLGYRQQVGVRRAQRREPQLHIERPRVECAVSFTNTQGSARPNTGAAVTIVPPGNQNVAVTGPAEAVSLGTLVIEGSGSYTASLALTSSGSLSAERERAGGRWAERQRRDRRRGAEHVGGHAVHQRRQRHIGQRRHQRRHGGDL